MNGGTGTAARGLYTRLDAVLRRLELVAVIIAAGLLLLAMVLTVIDASLRYTINRPLGWQFTFTEDYLLVGVFLMALPWGFRTGGYIRIDATSGFLPAGLQRLLIRAGLLLSAGYVAVLAWTSAVKYVDFLIAGEVKIGVVYWPIHYSWVWLPIGLTLLTLRLLLTAFGPGDGLESQHDPLEEL